MTLTRKGVLLLLCHPWCRSSFPFPSRKEVTAGSGRRGHVHEMYARTFAQSCKTPSTDPLLLFGL